MHKRRIDYYVNLLGPELANATRVAATALYQKRRTRGRGRNLSLHYAGERNPRVALAFARDDLRDALFEENRRRRKSRDASDAPGVFERAVAYADLLDEPLIQYLGGITIEVQPRSDARALAERWYLENIRRNRHTASALVLSERGDTRSPWYRLVPGAFPLWIIRG